MSKHKTSKKTLIIEDDEPKEGDERMNPFSFKEFIRTKNQLPYTADGAEKTSRGHFKAEDEFDYSSDFNQVPKGHFFTEPSHLVQSFQHAPEDEWTESFQQTVIEDNHKFGLYRTEGSSSYFDQSLVSSKGKDETADEWGLEEELSPEAPFHRRSTGSYEGDEETSLMDLTFHTKKSNTENVIRDQQKLREENSLLRKHIHELIKKSEADSTKIRQLTDELHNRKLQEEKEAKALETMVQSVEQNLQLMTKRAIKAENSLSKVKQESQQLQRQLDDYKCENDRLRDGDSATLNAMRQNAQLASDYLHKAAHDAETSIKQLLTGRETLCLVSQLLNSIDKIAEVQK